MNVSQKEFMDSQNAISQYIRYYNCSHKIRNARVIIEQSGNEIQDLEVDVFASIETNCSYVDISFDEVKLDNIYYARYKNEYQKFKWHKGTLSIIAEDKNGNNIKIYIN